MLWAVQAVGTPQQAVGLPGSQSLFQRAEGDQDDYLGSEGVNS
jgi:hypothetical protein